MVIPPRLILRTHPAQSRIDGRSAITEDPNDYLVVLDGPIIGRIYLMEHGPSAGRWLWFLQKPEGKEGMSDTLEGAKNALRECYFELVGGHIR